MDVTKMLTAYNMRTKENHVPIYNAVVNKITNGTRVSYSVKGTTEDKTQTLAGMTSLAKAEKAFADGTAVKGEGWN